MPLSQKHTLRLSFATWLFLIAMLVSLPSLGIAFYSTFKYSSDREKLLDLQLHERAEKLALQQDAFFNKIEKLLTALSFSPVAQAGDIAGIYSAAKLLQENSPEMSAISLVDVNDNLIFLTQTPLGTALPAAQIDSVREVFQTGKPNISNSFKGPLTGLPVYAINVPIVRNGRVVYCLRGIFRTQTLAKHLNFDNIPEKWIAGVVDRNYVLAARNVLPEKFVGETASVGLARAIREKNLDTWTGTTIEGIKTRAVYRPVGHWGWSIGLGVPEQILLKPLRDELVGIVIFTAVLLLNISGLAMALGYVLSKRLKQVALDAQLSLTHKARKPVASTRIKELDQLRESIGQAESYRLAVQAEVRKRTEELTEAQIQLTEFAIAQEDSIENERLRIAREVHDQIGAVFTGVSLMLNGIEGIDPARKEQLQKALYTGVKTAQRITSQLRPPLLDEFGLASAVLEMSKATLSQAGIVCNVELRDDGLLDAQQRIGCYRIIQEATTNVLRHAQASTCSIVGGATPQDTYVLVIADNGNVSPAELGKKNSFGLRGMQERAKLMGGQLSLIPLEKGLSVHVTLPLRGESENQDEHP